MRRIAIIACLASLAATPALADPVPIPGDPRGASGPEFIGAPAAPKPVWAPLAPQHPFFARNGGNNIHVDAYMSDLYAGPGPLGRDTSVSSTLQVGECGTLTFDSRGRIETVCVGVQGPRVELLDPVTLDEIDSFALPPRQPDPGAANFLTDVSSGGYFYLDERDRAVIPTTTRHLYVVAQAPGGLALEHDYDLTAHVPSGDKLFSAIPDWSGRIWFVSKAGIVGTIDPRLNVVKSVDVHEAIDNSLAVDETGGVYIVSDKAQYRFDAALDGTPKVTWREVYPNSGVHKPGQFDAGSGTTPTLVGSRYLAITDNADPMDVVVYRREASFKGDREVCRVPVFKKGASSSDNSLIVAGHGIVVENNYGYTTPVGTATSSAPSTPGVERVDIEAKGCRKVWHSEERSPSSVPKLSLSNGLVYVYARDLYGGNEHWYLTAIDFRTGKTIFKRLVGVGFGFNVNYAPISLGPTGAAYVGVLGGLVRVADAAAPPALSAPVPKPKLRLVRRHGTVRLAGSDAAFVDRVAFTVARRTRTDRRAPFSVRSGKRRVVAVATLEDGRTATLRRR